MLEAIGRALGDLRPARLSWGRGQATFGANRRKSLNPNGPTDPDVPVLSVDSPDGRPIAVVFTYACHLHDRHGQPLFQVLGGLCRSRGRGTGAAAAGRDGAVRRRVRRRYQPRPDGQDRVRAACTAGLWPRRSSASWRRPEELRPVRGPLGAAFREIELPLDKAPSRELLEKLLDQQVRRSSVAMRRSCSSRCKRAGCRPSVPYPILVWQFGSDLTLVGLSGEVCVDYALALKRELGPERTWVAGYANQVPCYIPSDRVLAEGGYEAGWGSSLGRAVAAGSILRYGWPVPLAPGLEDRIV